MNKEVLEKLRGDWQKRLKEWKDSGLTQAEYCRRNNLKVSQFLYWKKKFSDKKATRPSFVQVPMPGANRFFQIRIDIGSRFCVEVGNDYDPLALERIIDILIRS